MDLYNFFNRNTTGFLTNFLSEILKGPVKFVEYEERIRNGDTHIFKGNIFGKSGIKSEVKIFKFGLRGAIFEFIISSNNKIGFYFPDPTIGAVMGLPGSTSFYGSSLTNSNVESVRLNLLSILREYKINQIL